MAEALQNFTHNFFTGKGVVVGDGLVWASAESTPADLDALSTERFSEADVKISVIFNASATGSIKIHSRKVEDANIATETIEILAPGSATAQVRAWSFYGFSHLDIGIENADALSASVSVDIVSGVKVTGITAAA